MVTRVYLVRVPLRPNREWGGQYIADRAAGAQYRIDVPVPRETVDPKKWALRCTGNLNRMYQSATA